MTPAIGHPDIILSVRGLTQEFATHAPRRGSTGPLRAISNVHFEIRRGEALGLVGESGSGKTTLARSVLQSPKPTFGSVYFEGVDLTRLRGRDLVNQRRQMQAVFQDPFASLDPRWSVAEIVEEPLVGFRIGNSAQRQKRVRQVLDLVGLPIEQYGRRRSHELSGGQCQRVAIARAIGPSPSLIICDEAVSALDVLIQAQVVNLLEQLRVELGLSYLFISHDLALVKQLSDRLAVLNNGVLCEIGPSSEVSSNPLHPYTAILMSEIQEIPSLQTTHEGYARVRPFREETTLVPPNSGCLFQAHCVKKQDRCIREAPTLRDFGDGDHFVACHFPFPLASP